MKIKKFIEKAIKGGWNPHKLNSDWYYEITDHDGDYDGYLHFTDTKNGNGKTYHIGMIFLDPLAWQAVGKVEGWNELDKDMTKVELVHGTMMPRWKGKMHRMIDALAEGKSVEDFISTL